MDQLSCLPPELATLTRAALVILAGIFAAVAALAAIEWQKGSPHAFGRVAILSTAMAVGISILELQLGIVRNTDARGLPLQWVGRDHRPGGDTSADSAVDEHIDPNQTFLVSSASMNVPGLSACPTGPTTLCVMVWTGSDTSIAHVDGLSRGTSWFGWANAEPELAIADKMLGTDGWFSPGSCGQLTGCTEVWVYRVQEGIQVDLAMNPPQSQVCRPYIQRPIGREVSVPFNAFRAITGHADLEYWIADTAHRTRLAFDRHVIGYALDQPSRYGAMWVYPDACTPSELDPDFEPWRRGDGLTQQLAPAEAILTSSCNQPE